MNAYRADLHIHTRLSPCGSEEMTPRNIVVRALALGLDIIAICDHNACGNVASVMQVAQARSLLVVPGIEVETRERIHVVGLFPTLECASRVSEAIRSKLPLVDAAYTERYGEQVLLGPDDRILGHETKALAFSTEFDLAGAVALIQGQGGLAIAAHVERPSFSVYSQLGDVPRDIPFDALEVSPVDNRPIGIREKFSRYGWPLVGSSDSHYLSELGRSTSRFVMERPTFEEMGRAFHASGGRSVGLA